MTKTFLFSVVSWMLFAGANAATPWWEHDDVCRLNTATCYTNMGAGYLYDTTVSASWDSSSNCWGKKYICPAALKNQNSETPVAMERNAIANTNNVSADFDTTVLSNGECFGVRKTTSGGSQAYVNSQLVNVWCNAAVAYLDVNPDNLEELPNGTVIHGNAPTCYDLADVGYIGIQNGKCYGKNYDTSKYYIKCNSNKLDDVTLIVLNGAKDWNPDSNDQITTLRQANTRFNEMFETAKSHHRVYFKDN